jgi:hypothetical protein
MSFAITDLRQIVTEAGQLALRYYGTVTGSVKANQSMVSEADAAVEEFARSSLVALARLRLHRRESRVSAGGGGGACLGGRALDQQPPIRCRDASGCLPCA